LTDNHPVADAANTHRPLSKPLAAYILGYNSRILRLWQFLFWLWSGEGDTEQGVPNALDELRGALDVLGEDIPANTVADLLSVCDEIAAITSVAPGEDLKPWSYWFQAEHSTGYGEWREVVSLARIALSEKSPARPWYQLGDAIAHYQTELFSREDHTDLQSIPSLYPVLECAGALVQRGFGNMREIGLLAAMAALPWRPQVMLLARVVETPDCDLDYELSPSETDVILTRQMTDLNRRLRVALRAEPLLQPVIGQDGLGVHPRPEPKMLTGLQVGIMKALKNRALTKKALANEVAGGDGSRLYKPGGLPELRKDGLVDHMSGLGYYRPDAPPPDAVAPG